MRARLAMIALMAGAAGLVGCQDIFGVGVGVPGEPGGDAGADGQPDAGPSELCPGVATPEGGYACLVDLACDLFDTCLGETFRRADCFHTELELFDGVSIQVGEALLTTAIAAGTLTYDPAAMSACLDMLAPLECHDAFSAEFASRGNPLDQCRGFVGTVEEGSDCTFDLECAAPGARCQNFGCDDQVCCPGFCVFPAGEGEECQGKSGRDCGLDTRCFDGTCQDGRQGDSCFGAEDCHPDFWCDDGACAPDHPSGFAGCIDDAACPYPETCAGDDLALPGLLGGPTGVCARSIDTGDPCDAECLGFVTHFCDQPDPGALGACQPVGKRGETCNPDGFPLPCEVGLLCDGKLQDCVPFGDVGEPCFGDFDCWPFGRFCSNELPGQSTLGFGGVPPGVCSVRQPNGQPCGRNEHCQSGVCQDQICAALEDCEPIFPE